MESNRVTGIPYLYSYPGGLNILEELLNVTNVILIAAFGFSIKANIFCGVTILAAIHTAVFIFLNIKGTTRTSKWPWHWIECVSCLTFGILLAVSSSVVLSVLTRGYILTGVIGYLTAMVYFFDTFHKYQIAIIPARRYAWTTPNMPELN